MIKKSYDRVGSFGASDVKFFFMNYDTKTFRNWWFEKTGLKSQRGFSNLYTKAGDMLEQEILKTWSKQNNVIVNFGEKPFVYRWNKLLKVNLDGFTKDTNIEVKTSIYEKVAFQKDIPKEHFRQTQVQMLASKFKKTKLLIYGLIDKEYKTENLIFPEIDLNRLFVFDIEYDKKWLNQEYKPRLKYLSKCMKKNKMPLQKEIEEVLKRFKEELWKY